MSSYSLRRGLMWAMAACYGIAAAGLVFPWKEKGSGLYVPRLRFWVLPLEVEQTRGIQMPAGWVLAVVLALACGAALLALAEDAAGMAVATGGFAVIACVVAIWWRIVTETYLFTSGGYPASWQSVLAGWWMTTIGAAGAVVAALVGEWGERRERRRARGDGEASSAPRAPDRP